MKQVFPIYGREKGDWAIVSLHSKEDLGMNSLTQVLSIVQTRVSTTRKVHAQQIDQAVYTCHLKVRLERP